MAAMNLMSGLPGYNQNQNQMMITGLMGVPQMATAAPSAAPVVPTSMPVVPAGAAVPATGLIGAEQAITGGQTQSAGILGGAINTISGLNAYTLGGVNAAKLQADLTGANGPQAQKAAQSTISTSPASQYQFDMMQRATERSAAARGGLLGGNVLRELQANAAGIASQDYQNQFANLGTVADRGANMQSQADQIRAGLTRDIADTAYSSGVQRAGLRMDAGQAIAQNASQAASNIAKLVSDRGITLSDMAAKDISTITDIIYQSGIQNSMDQKNLAAILANIAGGQASTVAAGQAQIGAANAAGTIGVSNALQNGLTQAIGAGLLG